MHAELVLLQLGHSHSYTFILELYSRMHNSQNICSIVGTPYVCKYVYMCVHGLLGVQLCSTIECYIILELPVQSPAFVFIPSSISVFSQQ